MKRTFKNTAILFCFFLCCNTAAAEDSIEKKAFDFMQGQRQSIVSILSIKEPAYKFESVGRKVDELFDIPAIYRFVVAQNYRKIGYSNQYIVTDFFKKNLILSYIMPSNLNAGNLTFDLMDAEVEDLDDSRKRVTLFTEIKDSQKESLLNCTIVMNYDNGIFRIFDIKIDGVSMLISFRQTFNNILVSYNNDIDLMVNSMKRRIIQIEKDILNKDSFSVEIQEVTIQE